MLIRASNKLNDFLAPAPAPAPAPQVIKVIKVQGGGYSGVYGVHDGPHNFFIFFMFQIMKISFHLFNTLIYWISSFANVFMERKYQQIFHIFSVNYLPIFVRFFFSFSTGSSFSQIFITRWLWDMLIHVWFIHLIDFGHRFISSERNRKNLKWNLKLNKCVFCQFGVSFVS